MQRGSSAGGIANVRVLARLQQQLGALRRAGDGRLVERRPPAAALRVLDQGRADKITVIKFRRRKNYHRTKGHRQHETVLKITDISAKAAAKKAAPKAEEAPSDEAASEE